MEAPKWLDTDLVKYTPLAAQAKALARDSASAYTNLFRYVRPLDESHMGAERLHDGKLVKLAYIDTVRTRNTCDKRRACAMIAAREVREATVGQGYEEIISGRYLISEVARMLGIGANSLRTVVRKLGLETAQGSSGMLLRYDDVNMLRKRYLPTKGYCTAFEAQYITGLDMPYISRAVANGMVDTDGVCNSHMFYSVTDLVELRTKCIADVNIPEVKQVKQDKAKPKHIVVLDMDSTKEDIINALAEYGPRDIIHITYDKK